MKKIALILIIITGMGFLYSIEYGIKYDFIQEYDVSPYYDNNPYYDFSYDKQGYSVFLDVPVKIGKYFETGVGIEFQFARTSRLITYSSWDGGYGISSPDFYSCPVYLTNRILLPVKDFKAGVIGNIGYNTFLGDSPVRNSELKNGLYAAFGIEVIYRNFLAKLMNETNRGTIKTDELETDVHINQIGLSVGLSTDFMDKK